jgi:hypothetical protein
MGSKALEMWWDQMLALVGLLRVSRRGPADGSQCPSQMMELCGVVGDKAAVLPTTEAGEKSFAGNTGAGQGTKAAPGEDRVLTGLCP